MGAVFAGQLRRCMQGVEVDGPGNARRQLPRGLAIKGQAQPEEDILQTHDAQAHGAPAHVRARVEPMG